jgi:hypothetical protein
MEERMKSFSEIADIYEEWANADEAMAEMILADFPSSATEVERDKRDRASRLTAEATALRDDALELRKIEAAIDKLCGLTTVVTTE